MLIRRLLPFVLPSLALPLLLLMAACSPSPNTPSPSATQADVATRTSTPSLTPTRTATPSTTPTVTDTPTPSVTATSTVTSTPTDTPTITATATTQPVNATAIENANCRLGPDVAFLYNVTFDEGTIARVDGRNSAKTWLWIQIEGYDYHCWIVASAAALDGDINQVPRVPSDPPASPSVSSATGVHATRSGSSVTIAWNAAAPSVDLHYLVRAQVCNGQYLFDIIDNTTNTSYTVQDKVGCAGNSSARVFVVNKLGYSVPVPVPWP